MFPFRFFENAVLVSVVTIEHSFDESNHFGGVTFFQRYDRSAGATKAGDWFQLDVFAEAGDV